MTELEKTHLIGVLRGLRLADFNVNDAYSKLLKFTKKEMFSRDEIEEFFKKWDTEKEEETADDEENDKRNLAFMPDPVKRNITTFLDVQSRINFGNSAARIRDVVTTTPLHFDKLIVKETDEYFEISTENGLLRRYHNFKENCFIELGKEVRLVKNKSFRTEVGNYFLTIFKWKNLTIGTFEIDCEDEDESIIREAVFGVEPLKVNTLVMSNRCIDPLTTIINLDPKYLRNLDLGKKRIEMKRQIFEPDQWKNLETFSAGLMRFETEFFPTAFAQLKYCKFHSNDNITFDKFMELKECLLQNPNLCQLILMMHLSADVSKKLRALLGTTAYTPQFHEFDYRGIENNGKKLILTVNKKMVWYRGPEYLEERDRQSETIENPRRQQRGPRFFNVRHDSTSSGSSSSWSSSSSSDSSDSD